MAKLPFLPLSACFYPCKKRLQCGEGLWSQWAKTLGFYHWRAKHCLFLGMDKFSRSLESSPWLLLVARSEEVWRGGSFSISPASNEDICSHSSRCRSWWELHSAAGTIKHIPGTESLWRYACFQFIFLKLFLFLCLYRPFFLLVLEILILESKAAAFFCFTILWLFLGNGKKSAQTAFSPCLLVLFVYWLLNYADISPLGELVHCTARFTVHLWTLTGLMCPKGHFSFSGKKWNHVKKAERRK